MKSISNNIAEVLYSNGVIHKDDLEVCKYGVEIFLSTFLEISSILLISVFVGNFFETLIYFLAFVPLRIYAGGYHANTKTGCYLISLMVYFLFTQVMFFLPQQAYLITNLSCATISLIIILIAAPIIHHNKKTNETERKYYRKISINICSIESAIILIASILVSNSTFATSLALGQISVSITMLAAIIKKHSFKNKVS
jgi:accessory gene regulator B